MIRSRSPKDDEFTEKAVIGKPIVDSNGNIIGKCSGLIKDEDKISLKFSVKTELGSDFEVKELIPKNLVKQIGEVILLKKPYETKKIPKEDLITLEIGENHLKKKQAKSKLKPKKEIEKTKTNKSKNLPKIKEKKPIQTKKKEPVSETFSIKKEILEILELNKKTKETKQQKAILHNKIDQLLSTIQELKKEDNYQTLILYFQKNYVLKEKFLARLITKTQSSDLGIRLAAAETLFKLTNYFPDFLISNYLEILRITYNEPDNNIEKKLIKSLNKTAIEKTESLLTIDWNKFLTKLLIEREICKNITLKKIHNINLKIFVNIYEIQTIIINVYLLTILDNTKKNNPYIDFLQDYNAFIIAYTLILKYEQQKWDQIIKKTNLNKINPTYVEIIQKTLNAFTSGNIRKLKDILNPKIGSEISNNIIEIIVRSKINEALKNVSMLPLSVLCSFFNDDENSTIQIIYNLINKREINAQVVFLGENTYVTSE